MKFFPHDSIIALTSDASIDFTPTDFNALLTAAQQAYLKAQTGRDIPQVFWSKQIHGDDIVTIEHAKTVCPEADAFMTDQRGLPIAIRTADCVPVFIFDPIRRAIAVAHAGWKGTQAQIAAKTVKRMQDKFNSRCYDLKVVLGPSIRACCYEVGPEFKAHFPQDVHEREGKLYADVIAANRRQLVQAGLNDSQIVDSGVCTCCALDYFSFRRDGAKAGRMISLMMLL